MNRRLFILLSSILFVNRSFSAKKNNCLLVFESVKDFEINQPFPEGTRILLKSYHKGKGLGGGVFKLVKNSLSRKIDNGIIFRSSNDEYVWERSIKKNVIYPEWFGCLADGVFDDGEYLHSCLENISVGSTLKFRNNAIYFNAKPNLNNIWLINTSDIIILGDNFTLKRGGTLNLPHSYLFGNLATLTVRANNVKVMGDIVIDGGELKYPLSSDNGNYISKERFVRGSCSSHGLFIDKSENITFTGKITCTNAVFPCYINNSKKIDIHGDFYNSGQVYPVVGNDLQLGSCIKISQSANIVISGRCSNSAYSGCEIEPRSSNIKLDLKTDHCFYYGVIIHDQSKGIDLNLNSNNNIKGAGLRVSKGSEDVYANILVSNSPHVLIVSSMGKDICNNVNVNYSFHNISKDLVQIFNTDNAFEAIKNSSIIDKKEGQAIK